MTKFEGKFVQNMMNQSSSSSSYSDDETTNLPYHAVSQPIQYQRLQRNQNPQQADDDDSTSEDSSNPKDLDIDNEDFFDESSSDPLIQEDSTLFKNRKRLTQPLFRAIFDIQT